MWTIFHDSQNIRENLVALSRSVRAFRLRSPRSTCYFRFARIFFSLGHIHSRIFSLSRSNSSSPQFSLSLRSLAALSCEKYSTKTFYILLIQSMENFSLLRTTVEDCYRVAIETGGECEEKKNKEKSNEKICQDLEIKKEKFSKTKRAKFLAFILRRFCVTIFMLWWVFPSEQQKAFIFVRHTPKREKKTWKYVQKPKRRKIFQVIKFFLSVIHIAEQKNMFLCLCRGA